MILTVCSQRFNPGFPIRRQAKRYCIELISLACEADIFWSKRLSFTFIESLGTKRLRRFDSRPFPIYFPGTCTIYGLAVLLHPGSDAFHNSQFSRVDSAISTYGHAE